LLANHTPRQCPHCHASITGARNRHASACEANPLAGTAVPRLTRTACRFCAASIAGDALLEHEDLCAPADHVRYMCPAGGCNYFAIDRRRADSHGRGAGGGVVPPCPMVEVAAKPMSEEIAQEVVAGQS